MPTPTAATTALLAALAIASAAPALAQSVAILSPAEPAEGDHRHKLDIIGTGNGRLAITCRADDARAMAIALHLPGSPQRERGEVAVAVTRSGSETREFRLATSLDLLLAANQRAAELARWALDTRHVEFRAADGSRIALDLAAPKVAPDLARFRKLCQL